MAIRIALRKGQLDEVLAKAGDVYVGSLSQFTPWLFSPLAEQLQAVERAKEKFHLDRAERIARP